jgi:arginyl-tRNA synthetase
MFGEIKAKLHDFRVDFDVYFHEDSLHESGAVERAVTRLRELGHIYEADGATWLRTTDFGDDKDRVIIKSDGNAAYIAGDLAYYLDKRERGFDRVIIMLGADHHGYVGRMMAMCAAFGDTPWVNLEILIGQMVNLVKDGEPVRMSKRAGNIVTLRELIDEVGSDAARFNFVGRAADSHMDFDIELAKRQSAENPVYYVQYAHARIASILAQAVERGVDYAAGDVTLLREDAELALIRKMLRLPELVESMAESLEPHQLPYYAMEMATAFHDFYEKCRVLTDDEALTRARLKLVSAAKIVLARALDLMGMSAPERM